MSNGTIETIGGASVAAIIGVLTAVLALISQADVASLSDIEQISWIVIGIGGLLSFAKDYQAIAYRRFQAKVTGTGALHVNPGAVMLTAMLMYFLYMTVGA